MTKFIMVAKENFGLNPAEIFRLNKFSWNAHIPKTTALNSSRGAHPRAYSQCIISTISSYSTCLRMYLLFLDNYTLTDYHSTNELLWLFTLEFRDNQTLIFKLRMKRSMKRWKHWGGNVINAGQVNLVSSCRRYQTRHNSMNWSHY